MNVRSKNRKLHPSLSRIGGQIILLLGVILAGCDDGHEEIHRLKQKLNLEQFKTALLSAKDSVNLITGMNRSGAFTIISFESGDSLVTSSSLVQEIQLDSGTWQVDFTFSDQTVLTSFILGKLEIMESDITVNPFARCPLCALAKIEMPVKGRFKVIVKGRGDKGIPISKEFSRFDETHEIPILGLYADFRNEVEFIFLNKDGGERARTTVQIETAKIAENPTMTVLRDEYTEVTPHLYFSSNKPVGFDRQGNIRWYYRAYGDFLYIFPKLKNGNLIIVGGVDSYSYHSTHFFEVSPLGQVVKEFTVPNFLHHDIVEMPNGNFLVLSNSHPVIFTDGVSEEDIIVEIDRKTGTILKTWDLNNILDPMRTPIPSSRPDDWVHTNALLYAETDNSIIVSGRSQSAIIKIDYETGALKWIMGNHNKWKSEFHTYLLTAVDASGGVLDISDMDFWPSGQHSPRFHENGNLLVFDNGDHREFYNDTPPQPNYSRMVEYSIDEAGKKIHMVREFSHGKSLYTKYTGSVGYDPHLKTSLVGFMYTSEVLATPKIFEVDDGNVVKFEADFSPDLANYRALKIDLYENVNY